MIGDARELQTGRGARILIVDDEEAIRRSLGRLLERQGYACETAADAVEARRLLDSESFELMLCDVTMPGESGFSLLAYCHASHPDVAVIMVTAVDSPNAAVPAAEHGAYGYIIKPFDTNTILINVYGALRRRAERIVESSYTASLERDIASRSEELQHALTQLAVENKALSDSQEETVTRLAVAAEWRDPATGEHLHRMSNYTARLAELAGFDPSAAEQLRIASQMHDIGKVGLPDVVLLKPGPLSDDERETMKTHCEIGFKMLVGSDSPLIKLASVVCLSHHERYDGTGYPKGLRGTDIPFEGRIVAVADVYDALRSERPYKPPFGKEKALEIMRDRRGTHFDPDLLDLFVADVEAESEDRAGIPA
ncbi:MAG TPA: HD domain-containing phosphohydrolase [Acidimicrobiales bacterium]|nr:HD domain-containing phosphohydrolase [Acidimicrobiales bacterium]